MKAGREHSVPLTDDTPALIASDPTDSSCFFRSPSGYAISNMATLQLLRGIRNDGSTVLGFRSSFPDWAAGQSVCPRDVAEARLAHALGDCAELLTRGRTFSRGGGKSRRRGQGTATGPSVVRASQLCLSDTSTEWLHILCSSVGHPVCTHLRTLNAETNAIVPTRPCSG